jgi:LuxR family transcriptional regulator, maltose regulon positive regulatory protein
MTAHDSVAFNQRGAVNRRRHRDPGSAEPFTNDRRRLFRPIRRLGMTRRDRMLRDLTTIADDVPLVLLTAPAGYGKSTVLEQWGSEDRREFAWVHLEDADNDPIRLLRHIALALHRIRPIDYAAWRGLGAPELSVSEVVLPRLLTTTVASGPPWVLVFDDLHVLRGGLGPDLIVALANALPPGFHVAAAGRNQAGLKLSGLRRQGRCAEFGPNELAFTREEVASVLKASGARYSDDTVDELEKWTEGWPAGVYLAALSIRANPNPDVRARDLSGSRTFVFDYLREEVLLPESAEMRRFLLRTAPLDQMSAPLCDSVLDSTDAATRLAELEGRNLFVVRPDAERLWYRYRPLFREMLLAELRRWEPAEELLAHRRAAAWYEEHGYPEEAVSHALAGRDAMGAARLIARCGRSYLNSGRVGVVRGWLESLPDGVIAGVPSLAVVAGWTWAFSGDAARAQEALHIAERGALGAAGLTSLDEVPPTTDPSLVSRVGCLRAVLAPFGIEQMLADARRAFDLERPGSVGFPPAALRLGVAHLLNGDAAAARGELERCAHFGRERQRSTTSIALAQLSLIAADEDDWPVAEACATEASELMHAGRLTTSPFSVAVHAARAKVAIHQRNLQLARDTLARAVRLYRDRSPAAFPWFAAQMAIVLGWLALDVDDYPTALRKMSEARRHLARLPDDGLLGRLVVKLARDLAPHGDRLPYPYAVTLTTAEMRVLQLLPTHLTLSEIADALYISRNTVKTQVASIYGKLHSSTRAEAVRAARERDLVK